MTEDRPDLFMRKFCARGISADIQALPLFKLGIVEPKGIVCYLHGLFPVNAQFGNAFEGKPGYHLLVVENAAGGSRVGVWSVQHEKMRQFGNHAAADMCPASVRRPQILHADAAPPRDAHGKQQVVGAKSGREHDHIRCILLSVCNQPILGDALDAGCHQSNVVPE